MSSCCLSVFVNERERFVSLELTLLNFHLCVTVVYLCFLMSLNILFQLIKLESLAVYWNSHSKIYDGMDKAEILVG